MQTWLVKILTSNRVKLAIFTAITALFQKFFPDYLPNQETLNYLYGVTIALILGDSFRPVDPAKASAFFEDMAAPLRVDDPDQK